jgi:hypothetical protein
VPAPSSSPTGSTARSAATESAPGRTGRSRRRGPKRRQFGNGSTAAKTPLRQARQGDPRGFRRRENLQALGQFFGHGRFCPENTVGCNHEIVKRAVSQSSIVSGAQYTPVSPKSFWRAGIGGASRPLPEREQERPRLSATRLRRPRPKWPRPRRRSRSLPRRRTQNRPTRGKLPASRFPTDRPAACLDCWFRGRP